MDLPCPLFREDESIVSTFQKTLDLRILSIVLFFMVVPNFRKRRHWFYLNLEIYVCSVLIALMWRIYL